MLGICRYVHTSYKYLGKPKSKNTHGRWRPCRDWSTGSGPVAQQGRCVSPAQDLVKGGRYLTPLYEMRYVCMYIHIYLGRGITTL